MQSVQHSLMLMHWSGLYTFDAEIWSGAVLKVIHVFLVLMQKNSSNLSTTFWVIHINTQSTHAHTHALKEREREREREREHRQADRPDCKSQSQKKLNWQVLYLDALQAWPFLHQVHIMKHTRQICLTVWCIVFVLYSVFCTNAIRPSIHNATFSERAGS